MYCEYCGVVDEHYDENATALHAATPKHICNVILVEYQHKKKQFRSNREGVSVFCTTETNVCEDGKSSIEDSTKIYKIRVNVKPNQEVKFSFQAENTQGDALIVGMQLAHPQPQFSMNDHPYVFGGEPHVLKKGSHNSEPVFVTFQSADVGLFEMPVMFTFCRINSEEKREDKKKEAIRKNIIIIREMVVNVQENLEHTPYVKSPYGESDLPRAKYFIPSTSHLSYELNYKIPKNLKLLFPINLEEEALIKLFVTSEERDKLREVLLHTRTILDEGISESNYVMYFHYLLWWEEIVSRINLKKYNMIGVQIDLKADKRYWLDVPGLAEKRPSLLRGDRALIRPEENTTVLFESIIDDIRDNSISIGKIREPFDEYYRPSATFNVRFLTSRVPMERMHSAVDNVFSSGNGSRVFPRKVDKRVKVKPIKKFYNPLIKDNEEQRSAVEHIVSKTSGQAPYIVFGPPGTGKTMTIVEAIVQIVVKNPQHRVFVCTDSNMAADHIAMKLLEYQRELKINRMLLRACSRNREWSIMPPELKDVSNGSSYEVYSPVGNDYVATFRVVVTTLLHSAKYSFSQGQSFRKLKITHLFIDEAAQAKEPAALVPISGLLTNKAQLVLAGDPKQLGPVCMSRNAGERGLGESLLERLWKNYKDLYENDPHYITVLVNNFRSHPDILKLPNELFYGDNPLQAKAAPDSLSDVSVLGLPGGDRALVFHSVNSNEQRNGSSPSFYNEKELIYLQKYTLALINQHAVSPKDIGIIAPYIKQVYKMRDWLKNNEYADVEIGTVESFQGKEKRVILVSTVRANCKYLDYDAKYGLGFLVDDKRFNVTLTRAKAKLVIIGNPACLTRDIKWRMYMEQCTNSGTYHGRESEQLPRNSSMLVEIAKTRFDKCRLTEELKFKLIVEEDKRKRQ